MAPHDGAAQAEERSPLRLPNKIADSDPNKNRRIRRNIENDVNRSGKSVACFLQNISILTTLLPPHWKKLPPELKQFVEKEMFDPVLRQVLEDDNIINWAPSATKLYPLITTGDGNCLLHAVSLAMWGIEDDDLFLRNLLHEALVRHDLESRKRWQRERKRLDERIPGSGLRYNTMEWRNEWEMVIKIASGERRPANAQGLPYECLEEFHVFMLANILRRPIIVMAQQMWRDLEGHSLQPQNFSGIYLPLKWKPEECNKHPIVLGYYQMHFVPLVYTDVMDGETPATDFAVPLVSQDHNPLEIHFLMEEEDDQAERLLSTYLSLEEVPHMDINESMASTHVIQGAKLATNRTPDDSNLLISYFKLVETHYRFYLETEYNPQSTIRGAGQSQQGQQGQAEDTKFQLESQMSKANLDPVPQASDLWTPAANPNYQSNTSVSANAQAYTQQGQTMNETSQPQRIAGNSYIGQSCKTKDCPYYQSVSTGEYCHECYNRLKKAGEGKNFAEPVKCRTEGCLNITEPGQEHCQVCQASAKFQGNVGSVTAPSAPLPSNIVYPSEPRTVVSDGIPEANPHRTKPYQSAHILSNNSDDLTTLMVNTQRVGSRKCIMPECELTGHPHNNDMCRKCFEENRRIHDNVMAQTGTATLERPPQIPQEMPQSSAPSGQIYQPRKCRTQGCPGIGNPHLDGYCTECSIKISPSISIERPKYPQNNTASPPSIPPPDYNQALRMLQSSAGGYQDAVQHGYAAGYTNPNPQQTPVITVQKHICMTPGCLGVRLDNGYCFECVQKNRLAKPPPRTQTPPPTPKQNWITSTERRSQTPPVASSTANRPLQSEGYGYPSRNSQPLPAGGSYQAATKTVPLSHPSTRTCRHPKCDRPAAPPKYILCEECIQIAELWKNDEAGVQYGNRSGSGQLPPGATPWTAEDMPQHQRSQAMHAQSKPKASPSKKAPPANMAYIPRLKCQAPGGCKDDMFGDPELNNLCSSCFKESLMRPPFHKPADVHSAPLKPSARIPKRQTSHSQVLQPPQQARVVQVPSHSQAGFGNQVLIATGPSPAAVQVGQVPLARKCFTPDCTNPANPNILEGYCNNCYRTYNDVYTESTSQASVIAQPSRSAARPQPRPVIAGQSAQPYGHREQPVDLPTPKPTKIHCKHGWCTNYGNPRCFGYCNECYKLTQMSRTGHIPH